MGRALAWKSAPPNTLAASTVVRCRSLPAWVLLVGVVLVLPYVYATTFTDVMPFDDQGALMITLQDVMHGRRLYNDEYALYGPFYYLTVGALFTGLHLPLTHDVVRLVAAVFWVACVASFSGLVYRMTNSLAASGLAFLTTLLALSNYPHSPTHPEEISLLLLACIPYLLFQIQGGSTQVPLVIIGAIVAGLALTKINIGAFVAIATALAVIRVSERNVWSHLGYVLFAVGGVLLPLALLRPLFEFSWAIVYCVFASATIACSLFVWWYTEAPVLLTFRHWVVALSAAIVTVMITVGLLMLRGTTPDAMFNAIVLQNAHYIQNWYIMLWIGPPGGASTLLATAAALAYVFLGSRPSTRNLADQAVPWLKLVMGLLGIALIYATTTSPFSNPELFFKMFEPFCWLLIVPPAHDRSRMTLVRGGIGLLSAFMVLYPFPVAADQLRDAILLPSIMVPVLLHDAIVDLRALGRIRRWELPNWTVRLATLVAVLFFVGIFANQTRMAVAAYASRVALDLPGAALIHVSEETANTYHWATQELSRCEAFYTMPGQLSFYFFTGKQAPTGVNSNNELGLLTWDQQERVIADLSAYRRMCVLTVPGLRDFWDRGQIATHPPLLQYIEQNFVPVAVQEPYTLLERKP
jgi:hypothetical protein